MPSAGMRRLTRVLVVNSADGARVLRSGRRLWPDSAADESLKIVSEDCKKFRNFDNNVMGKSDDYTSCEIAKNPVVIDADGDDDARAPQKFDTEDSRIRPFRRWGLVYHRKRKKFIDSSSENRGDRRYGKYFVRRRRRKIVPSSGDGGRTTTTTTTSLAVHIDPRLRTPRVSRFLASILLYLKRNNGVFLCLRDLSSFLVSGPIREILCSQGFRSSTGFVPDLDLPSPAPMTGFCKISGVRENVPLLSVDFSAIPNCFLHIHMTAVLRFAGVPPCFAFPPDSESDELVSDEAAVFCCRSSGKSLRRRRGRPRGLRGRPWRSSATANTWNHHSFGSRRRKLYSAGVTPERSWRRRLGDAAEAVDSDPDAASASCSANLLIFGSGESRCTEAKVTAIEFSDSRLWMIAVCVDGCLRYRHLPEKVMRPCSSDRSTHAVIWPGDDGWKLEFCGRRDFVVFKELYQDCVVRNARASSFKLIPVPEVREILGQEPETMAGAPALFLRPKSYISVREDEVSRAMSSRSATYDMDSEDEAWLGGFNGSAVKEEEMFVSEEAFELMIDAFEKAYFCSPEYYSDQNSAVNLCIDVGPAEAVQPVFEFWTKKRMQRRSPLVRVFQSNEGKKCGGGGAVSKAVMKRRRSWRGRGKQRSLVHSVCV